MLRSVTVPVSGSTAPPRKPSVSASSAVPSPSDSTKTAGALAGGASAVSQASIGGAPSSTRADSSTTTSGPAIDASRSPSQRSGSVASSGYARYVDAVISAGSSPTRVIAPAI